MNSKKSNRPGASKTVKEPPPAHGVVLPAAISKRQVEKDDETTILERMAEKLAALPGGDSGSAGGQEVFGAEVHDRPSRGID